LGGTAAPRGGIALPAHPRDPARTRRQVDRHADRDGLVRGPVPPRGLSRSGLGVSSRSRGRLVGLLLTVSLGLAGRVLGHETQPELAGKLTGMLIEMDSSEVLYLLENDEAMAANF
jgi:hypothetical protein